MYEYEARHYDAAIARFVTIDPLAEDYSYQNPYAYAVNNPIFFIDKLGMGPHGPGDDLLKKASSGFKKITSAFSRVFSVFSGTSEKVNEVKTRGEKSNTNNDVNDKAEAIIEANESVNENAGDVAIGMAYSLGDSLDKGGSEVAEKAALTTLATGGLSSEVTVPVAAAAGTTSTVGKGIRQLFYLVLEMMMLLQMK